jgi:hypothetical protein
VIFKEEDRSMEAESSSAELQSVDQVCIAFFGEGDSPKTCLVVRRTLMLLSPPNVFTRC